MSVRDVNSRKAPVSGAFSICIFSVVLAVALAFIKAFIGLAYDLVDDIVGSTLADTYRHCYGKHSIVLGKLLLTYQGHYLIGEKAPLFKLLIGDNKEEFLSAPPCGTAAVREIIRYDLGYGGEHAVSEIMTVGIIDLLEIVDISDAEHVVPACFSAFFAYFREILVHCAAVAELCQGIDRSHNAKLFVLYSQLAFGISVHEGIYSRRIYQYK